MVFQIFDASILEAIQIILIEICNIVKELNVMFQINNPSLLGVIRTVQELQI